MITEKYYAEKKQYGARYSTDAQNAVPDAERSYVGIMNFQARFIEEKQLLFKPDWELFVKQFKSPVDDPLGTWKGEYFGKMMRGSCMTYQYTKNDELYAILEAATLDMLTAQDPLGRFSTYSPTVEFSCWDLWCKKYVILGLLHFHEICRDEALKERIVKALEAHLDYITERVGDGDGKKSIDETSVYWGALNSSSILEPVVRMYNLTGKKNYLDFASHIVDRLCNGANNIITLALEDKILPYQYPSNKAYEMMSCFEGILEYYRVTGEEKYKEAVVKFADAIIRSEITLTGGAGCNEEQFNYSVKTQTDPDYKGIMLETCVTVTWMKLCNQLLTLTGEPKYADYIEKAYYNSLCGAINNYEVQKKGGYLFDSYSPITAGIRGRVVGGYQPISDTRYYGCCVAIGAAGTSLPLLTAAMATEKGIALNYYESGSLNIGSFALDIETAYPTSDRIKITVKKDAEGEIKFRIPAFVGTKNALFVNGKRRCACKPVAESYLALEQVWRAGDTVELVLDMNPRIVLPVGMEDKPESLNYMAVCYGPLALARDARIGEVGTPVSPAKKVTVEKVESDIPCQLRAKVTLGKTSFDMIDYGSAGKTWEEDSLCEVWMRTK